MDDHEEATNSETNEIACDVPCEGVLSGTMKKLSFLPLKHEDLWIFLHNQKKSIIDSLENELKKKQSIKFFLCIKLVVKKYTITENGPVTSYEDMYRRTSCVILLLNDIISRIIEEGFNDLIKKVTDYNEHGSGWIIHKIEKLELYFGTYKPIDGRSYIPTPKEFIHKLCLVNIRNNDMMCFKWSVLAAIHPPKHHQMPSLL